MRVLLKISILSLLAIAGAFTVTTARAQLTELYGVTHVWKYSIDCQDGTGWEASGFDDSGWLSGPGGFTGGETLAGLLPVLNTRTLPAPTAAGIAGHAYYFRTHFNIASIDSVSLLFSNAVDDGAVVYLNGTRLNSVTLRGPVTDTCTATTGGQGAPATGTEAQLWEVHTVTTEELAGILVPGDNVIAVSVHQSSTTSSDSVFAQVLMQSIAAPPVINYATSSLTNRTVIKCTSTTLSASVSGVPAPTYQWFHDGTPITDATNASLTITNVQDADAGSYHVEATNPSGTATSTPDTVVTLTDDVVGPLIVSALGDAGQTNITIVFNEPMDTGPFFEANFFVTDTNTGTDVPVTSSFAANSTTLVLVTDPRDPTHGYSVSLTEMRDACAANPLAGTGSTNLSIRLTVKLIDLATDNNVWKYDINNGDRFGTGWETVSYDDSAWPSGPAPLGLDASATGNPQPVINTTLGYLGNGVPVYFRRHFLVPDTNGVVLTLFDVVEDGAVYYINGQEVFRHRVNAGAVTFTTVAVGATENTGPEGPFSIPATNLVAGDNVIAAVVIQSTLAGSTDIEFAAELHAIVSSVPSGPPVIAAQPQGQSVAEGATVTFSVTASGAQPLSYQWRLNGGDITGANSSSYTINGVAPAQAGTYTVVVANSVDSVTSANAVLNVSPDVTAPVYISAIGSPNLTNITLTITDNFGLNQASVEDISHYSVHLTAGGGNLTIVSATLVNNSNILLTTSERTQSQSYTVDINNIIDRAQTPNAVAPLSRPLLAGIVVLAPDAVTLWRFETSSNNLDGIGWQAPAFNDASWTTGLAGFTTPTDEFSTNGFELRTTNMIAPDSSGPITTYYRVPFNFPGAVANARLHIIGVIDDGLVAYINGVEAGRLRVTNNPVSFTNLASANSPEATGNIHLPLDDVLLNTSALVTGNNLLAIELHQSSATSSDAVLSVQLAAEIEQFGTSPTGPTLRVSLGGGSVTITWTGGGTLQRSLDLNSPSNWQTIPGAISGFQTNVSATNQMFFRVTVP